MSKTPRYPLFEHERHRIKSITNKPIGEIQIANLAAGELVPEDLRIHSDSLLDQAQIARQAGFSRLAENLERAAELTRLPNEDL
jgi:propanediol dehydratase small subunit